MAKFRVTIETTKPEAPAGKTILMAFENPKMNALLASLGLPHLDTPNQTVLEDLIFDINPEAYGDGNPFPLIKAEAKKAPGFVRISSWDELSG